MSQNRLIESVENRIHSVWPTDRWAHTPTIVAVSGGPDSISLLHAMIRLVQPAKPSSLVVAHVNHGIRGEASDADARFVEAVSKELSLPFYLGSRHNKDHAKPDSSEDSLRDFRYRCLREAAQQHGARYVVTGHTLDDQIETVLFRILRGTGLRGLTGIPQFRKLSDQLTLVRPMLSIERSETQAYVNAIGQPYRVDKSNEDSQYTRNFLRNELLPLARKRFPDIDRAIVRLSEAASDQQQATPELAAAARKAFTFSDASATETGLQINCKTLQPFPESMVVDALIESWNQLGWPRGNINRATWLQVAQLIRTSDQQRQVINLPGNIRAERVESELRFIDQTTDVEFRD